jgi:tetratricopeptide (TPR) repeat protein
MRPLSEADYQLIERYAGNELTGDELTAFNERLKEKSFADAVRLHVGMEAAIENVYRLELRKQLKESLPPKQIGSLSTRSTKSRAIYYWTAAAIFVGCVVTALYFYSQQSKNKNLFYAHYQPYPAQVVTRSSITSQEEALILYEQGKYAEALPLLIKLKERAKLEVDFVQIYLLIANCYLNEGDVTESLANLDLAKKSTDPNLRLHADWYYALALLKANERGKATVVLQQIKNSNSIYSAPAANLLREL